jgi:NAD(P) transhydrogenase subunit alpha
MKIGVPKETFPGERRVALVPGVLATLGKLGLTAVVERGAGEAAGFPDAA